MPRIWKRFYSGHKTDLRPARKAGLSLTGLTDFQLKVLAEVARIPFGEVRTYKWIARKIGKPQAVRAVGSSLKKNPYPLIIPCHRVIKSSGDIGGYSRGNAMKKRLINFEKTLKNIFCLISQKEV